MGCLTRYGHSSAQTRRGPRSYSCRGVRARRHCSSPSRPRQLPPQMIRIILQFYGDEVMQLAWYWYSQVPGG